MKPTPFCIGFFCRRKVIWRRNQTQNPALAITWIPPDNLDNTDTVNNPDNPDTVDNPDNQDNPQLPSAAIVYSVILGV